MKILTDEQIAKTIQESLGEEAIDLKDYDWMVTPQDKAIAQAQLDQDKADAEAEKREIFKQIDEVLGVWENCMGFCELDCNHIPYNLWQALKSKYLKE
jgi:hypothetical protein